MPTEHYVDIFAAKDRVTRLLRDKGAQPYSGILMNAQLPQDVLDRVLILLEQERKVKTVKPERALAETTYYPISSAWSLSGARA